MGGLGGLCAPRLRAWDRALAMIAALAVAGAFARVHPCAQVTARVETRPVYGATVTLEHGVRVYRPLPPPDRAIINPGGRKPLVLGEYGYSNDAAASGDGDEGDIAGAPSGFVGAAPAGTILPRRVLRHPLGDHAYSHPRFPHDGQRHMGHPHRWAFGAW
jgi:hypothetical protein